MIDRVAEVGSRDRSQTDFGRPISPITFNCPQSVCARCCSFPNFFAEAAVCFASLARAAAAAWPSKSKARAAARAGSTPRPATRGGLAVSV